MWHNVGDDGAVLGWLLWAALPVCGDGVVFCCVLLWWCSLRLVIYNFFLYDVAALLPFIKKKEFNDHFIVQSDIFQDETKIGEPVIQTYKRSHSCCLKQFC
jgi:hypothetical protein